MNLLQFSDTPLFFLLLMGVGAVYVVAKGLIGCTRNHPR